MEFGLISFFCCSNTCVLLFCYHSLHDFTFCILADNVCISLFLVSNCQTISKLALSCLLLSWKKKAIRSQTDKWEKLISAFSVTKLQDKSNGSLNQRIIFNECQIYFGNSIFKTLKEYLRHTNVNLLITQCKKCNTSSTSAEFICSTVLYINWPKHNY